MEKKDWGEILAGFGLWNLVEDISDDGDGKGGELQLTKDGKLLVSEIEQEIEKAREEGREVSNMEKKGVGIGKDKCILDACCGGRMFWFNKTHPNVLYVDNRRREKGYSKFRPNHTVLPDEEVDFRNMPYKDKSFKLVVFDPPHIFGKENSLINQYYGSLDKETWREDIKRGFDECWRVLDDYGVLVFKWNEVRIPKKDILLLIERQPLFGHQVGGRMQTHWMCFMKIPK